MKRFLVLCCGIIVALGLSNTAHATPLTLSEDGKPRAVIVLGAGMNGYKALFGVAQVLADHIGKMTGGYFKIINESALGDTKLKDGRLTPASPPAGKDIYILLGEGMLTKKCGVTTAGLGTGGIVLKTLDNTVVIAGVGPGGDSYAVYQFLELLGCRYLWPGELGKVIPFKPTLQVPELDIRYLPPIGQRNIRFMTGLSERPATGLYRLQLSRKEWEQGSKNANATEPDAGWAAWHRLGGDVGIRGGHEGAGLKGGWKEYGGKHPEWFALQADGTRDQSAAGDRWRLCKSNLELIKFVADSIIKRASKDPNLKCVSLSPNDGGFSSFCMCENCKKLDPANGPKIKFMVIEKVGKSNRREIEYVALTDRMVWYWNQIAERVTKVHPEMFFLAEAYSAWSTPPVREKLHPNLIVRYVPSGIDGWEGWQNAGCKRIYWRPNILLTGRADGKLHVMVKLLADTMGFMADRGMLATDFDSIINNWAVQGLNYYAAARLNWNPHLTTERILDEYCSPGFGPGSEHVKRYFLTIQDVVNDSNKQFTPEILAVLRSNLNAAEEAAGGNEAICDRIRFLRMGLNFTDLQCTLDGMVKLAKSRNQTLDRGQANRLLELNYMTLRDIVINHNAMLNAPYLAWASGDFVRWATIGGRNYRPTKERLEQAERTKQKFTLTGRENNLEDMIKSLGLDQPTHAINQNQRTRGTATDGRTEMDADEQGRPMEMPAN